MESIAVPQDTKLPCSSEPDLWISDGPRAQERAKARCLAECDPQTLAWCLREGIHERFGVYGGTTPSDREAMKASAA